MCIINSQAIQPLIYVSGGLRIVKDTKQKVLNALRLMLEEMPLYNINVKDLISRAGISRQTFYYHFHSLQDVFVWRVESSIPEFPARDDREIAAKPRLVLVSIAEIIRSDEKFCSPFLKEHPVEMLDRAHDYLLPIVKKSILVGYGSTTDPDTINILSMFFTDGYIGILKQWFSAGMPIGMAEALEKMQNAWEGVLDPGVIQRFHVDFE